jgi:hypothetical protein
LRCPDRPDRSLQRTRQAQAYLFAHRPRFKVETEQRGSARRAASHGRRFFLTISLSLPTSFSSVSGLRPPQLTPSLCFAPPLPPPLPFQLHNALRPASRMSAEFIQAVCGDFVRCLLRLAFEHLGAFEGRSFWEDDDDEDDDEPLGLTDLIGSYGVARLAGWRAAPTYELWIRVRFSFRLHL